MSFNRDNNKCPCKGCGDRVVEPNCHGSCEKYLAWKQGMDQRCEMKRQDTLNRDTISEAKKRAIWRSKRYSRQNNGYKAGIRSN